MEELQAKHRKEQKDIQSRITQKKKSATKKTRKGINDDCERLQRELLEKQKAEIAQLNGDADSDLNNGVDGLAIEDARDEEENDQETPPKVVTAIPQPAKSVPVPENTRPKKGNRQKARMARRAAEREADAEKAAEEAASQTDHRANEQKAMHEVFDSLRLKEKDIAPDGHCLYSAVATQLKEVGVGYQPLLKKGEPVSTLDGDDAFRLIRATTADFISSHADDFLPFLEESLQAYTRKIKLTSEWGGQLELQAMARAYGVQINVIQGDGRIEKFHPNGEGAEDSEAKNIWLAYYRHTYGLGEHYNALTRVA